MMSCEFHIEASLENGKFPHRSRRNFAGQGPLEEEEEDVFFLRSHKVAYSTSSTWHRFKITT